MASTSCNSSCSCSPANRSRGASATTAQTSSSTAIRRGAPAPGTLLGTPRSDGAFADCTRQNTYVAASRVVIDGDFDARDAMLVIHNGFLRPRARLDFPNTVEDVGLNLCKPRIVDLAALELHLRLEQP